jgi:hypothetical protein
MVMRINVPIEETSTELLHGDPVLDLQAATKHYVDSTIASTLSTFGVSSFNTRIGAVSLSTDDIVTALGYTPINNTSIVDGGTF